MLLLFQFQMTHGKDEMDDLQCKSCVCVLCFGQLLEHYSLYSMLKRKKEQLFAWLPETFSLLLLLLLFFLFLSTKMFHAHEDTVAARAMPAK